MDALIVDSNLLFSAAIAPKSGIGQFIINKDNYGIRLYAPGLLKVEIEEHFDRMVKVSRLPPSEVKFNLNNLYMHIIFIDDAMIPWNNYVDALRIVRDIDPYDVTFVALTDYMEKYLWTGDNELYSGLRSKGYDRVINFKDIKRIYNLV